MKNNLIFPLIAAMLLTGAACSGDRKTATQQAQYDTVQEGSAAGVTTTIHGPGEVVPPLTDTNADTTTAFALNPNGVPTTTTAQPGTVAGTMPVPPSGMPSTAYPNYPPPMTSATPTPTPLRVNPRRVPPPPQQQPVPTEPQPVQTDTSTTTTTQQPPTQTDTTATEPPPPTQTAPPPAEQPKKEQEQNPPAEEGQAEKTETAAPPPPPPPGLRP